MEPASSGVPNSYLEESPESLILSGNLQAAREIWRQQVAAEPASESTAAVRLALLEALGFGSFEQAISSLRALTANQVDEDVGAALVYLLCIDGQTVEAWKFLGAGTVLNQWSVGTRTAVTERLLMGALAEGSEPAAAISEDLLKLNPQHPLGLAASHRFALYARRFPRAAETWRFMFLMDMFDEEYWGPAQQRVLELLQACTDSKPDWSELAVAYAAAHAYEEAAYCAAHAPQNQLSGDHQAAIEKAQRFLRFRTAFHTSLRDALGLGFHQRAVQKSLTADLPSFADILLPGTDVTADTQIFDALRHRYGHALVIDWSHPIMSSTALMRILDDRTKIRSLGTVQVEFQRVLCGPSLADLSAMWDPLLGKRKSAVFVPWWPGAILQNLTTSSTHAQGSLRVWQTPDPDPAEVPAWDLDEDAAPLTVVSAFGVGNQGRHCLERRRSLAERLASANSTDEVTVGQAFRKIQLEASLEYFEIHELQHLLDRRAERDRGAEWTDALSEFRAYLASLRYGSPMVQLDVLATVATGGDKATTRDPYEVANYDLLEELLRSLVLNKGCAPQVDRERNMQAQLHRLDPEDLKLLCGFIWQRRFPEE